MPDIQARLRRRDNQTATSNISGGRRKLIRQFCDSTSAHGFHKIVENGGGALHRVAWLLIILLAGAGFTAHLVALFSRYFERPVNTETSVYGTKFVFPDVTICATSHFSRLRYHRNPHVPSLNISTHELLHHIRTFWDPGENADANISINADVMHSMKSYLREVNITKQRQEMILHCDFAGDFCSYQNFSQYVDPNYFSCYTFTPNQRHLIVGGERDGGLNVILYVGDVENFITGEESLSYSEGFRAVIHEPGSRPELLEGFYVQRGTSTYVQLGYMEEVVLKNCALDADLQPVKFVDRYNRITKYRYTIRDCLVNTYQTYLRTNCSCVSEALPLPANLNANLSVPFCHSISRESLMESIDQPTATDSEAAIERSRSAERRRACHDEVVSEIHKKTSGLAPDACPLRCNNARYEMRFTQNRWPSACNETRQALAEAVERTAALAAKQGDDLTTLEEIQRQMAENREPAHRDSFTKLTIYSHSTMGSVMRESWAYPDRNLASDIGGILGLWLGVSIISTFEFLELFARLLCWRVAMASTAGSRGGAGGVETQLVR